MANTTGRDASEAIISGVKAPFFDSPSNTSDTLHASASVRIAVSWAKRSL